MTAAKRVKRLVSRLNRNIEKDNRAFERMSPAGKRAQIARDVLKQLAQKRLVAERGTYLDVDVTLGARVGGAKVTADTEVGDVLKTLKKCTGCAVGGLFLCAVERADRLKVSDLSNYDYHKDEDGAVSNGASIEVGTGEEAYEFLRRFFSERQLAMIDNAFEADGGDEGSFVGHIADPGERMRLIMENIIAHKGRFVPGDKPEATYSTPGFKE